jgi:hypothetical protein
VALTFVPWTRAGIASAIATPDPGAAGAAASRVAVTVTLGVSGTGTGTAATMVRLYGPGDVAGIDGRQVIRTDPAPGATNAEPNYFPLVEFDRPDFPWLFSPVSENALGQLRPWVVLVVLPRDESQLDVSPARPLPVIHVPAAASQLPDLSQSWAWAHAQVAGSATPLEDALGSDSDPRTLSRLLAPRRLRANTAYLAAVVPAFEQGRLAGLGKPPEDAAAPLAPAWTPTTTDVELPVYHSWEFSTGPLGDFEALAIALERRELDPIGVGSRPLKVSAQGGVPALDTRMPGALTAGDPTPADLPAAREPLRALLDLAVPLAQGTTVPEDLVMRPPLYGGWHAARAVLGDPGGADWLRGLNLHPAHRAAAALGTRVVQDQQEALMEAAWRQAGDVLAANALLRSMQLARAASGSTDRRVIATLPDTALLLLTAPAHSRLLAGDQTLKARRDGTRVPTALLGPAARRLLRRRGPLGRRLAGVGADTLVMALNADPDLLVPPRSAPRGTITFDSLVEGRPRLCELTPSRLRDAQIPVSDDLNALWRRFQDAAIIHQVTVAGCDVPASAMPPELPVAELAAAARAGLDPEKTLALRAAALVRAPASWRPKDPLEPIMAAPDIPSPMYRPLAALSQDFILPGLDAVPPNTIAGLSTNGAFVESYMVGVNHEMNRELLWRGYPTDLRGTPMRRFWDPPPAFTGVAERRDIEPIHGWDHDAGLGTHVTAAEAFTVLIRGELLRRYPRTVIYLARAEWDRDENGAPRRPRRPEPLGDLGPADQGFAESYPRLSGSLDPDVSFVGFAVATEEVVGEADPAAGTPGYFVVLQQPGTEVRFGLNELERDPEEVTGSWSDLAWSHVTTSEAGYIDLTGALPDGVVTDPTGLAWGTGSTSAQLAAIVTQRPFRIAIHASDLVA